MRSGLGLKQRELLRPLRADFRDGCDQDISPIGAIAVGVIAAVCGDDVTDGAASGMRWRPRHVVMRLCAERAAIDDEEIVAAFGIPISIEARVGDCGHAFTNGFVRALRAPAASR